MQRVSLARESKTEQGEEEAEPCSGKLEQSVGLGTHTSLPLQPPRVLQREREREEQPWVLLECTWNIPSAWKAAVGLNPCLVTSKSSRLEWWQAEAEAGVPAVPIYDTKSIACNGSRH